MSSMMIPFYENEEEKTIAGSFARLKNVTLQTCWE